MRVDLHRNPAFDFLAEELQSYEHSAELLFLVHDRGGAESAADSLLAREVKS